MLPNREDVSVLQYLQYLVWILSFIFIIQLDLSDAPFQVWAGSTAQLNVTRPEGSVSVPQQVAGLTCHPGFWYIHPDAFVRVTVSVQ